jgi:pimeloyl-ACP methyl ester carboxylesterase
VSWCFYHQDYKTLAKSSSTANEIESLVNMTIATDANYFGPLDRSQMKPNNMRCDHIRISLDEFQSQVRPLIYYLAIYSTDFMTSFILGTLMGFTWVGSTNGNSSNSYYYRPAIKESEDGTEQDAIVFVHGLGIGIFPYLPFLLTLIHANPHRPIVLLEQRHIATQLHHTHIPTRVETLQVIDDIFHTRLRTTSGSLRRAHWIGHSFGTFVVGWIAKRRADYISGMSFVDPVSFNMLEPDLPFNFLYRTPSTGFDLLVWYAAAQEINTSRAIRRHFTWYENILYPEQLPRKVSERGETVGVNAHVYLSGNDTIINAASVKEYLGKGAIVPKTWRFTQEGDRMIQTKHECYNDENVEVAEEDKIPVTLWDGYYHAQCLAVPSCWKEIIDKI